MLNGSVTPLGRQLRTVLASFRSHPVLKHARHASGAAAAAELVAEVPLAEEEAGKTTDTPAVGSGREPKRRRAYGVDVLPDGLKPRKGPTRGQINRRARVDRITEALTGAGHASLLPRPRPLHRRADLSHMNPRSRTRWPDYQANSARHRDDRIPKLAAAKEPKLSRILASFIQHQAIIRQSPEEDEKSAFELRPQDKTMTKAKGFRLKDLEAWAHIVAAPDSLAAATALDTQVREKGISSVPFFLVAYLLRRETIRASALRMLMHTTWQMLEYHTSSPDTRSLPSNAIFLTFVRLTRHARMVWPAALESMAELLLRFLPRAVGRRESRTLEQLEEFTFQLNKAMRLLAMPTDMEPFKGSHVQEAAIVRILRFMAQHDPPIGINREGYRAVVLVQLAQPKTANDRQWAELKALSWPPWKEEKTAMDAYITRETHGISKAAETLLRMYEAGYGPGEWERAASIYAGWDHDLTPTIQRRALLRNYSNALRSGTASWVARIEATRTVQEAWACYEAYEKEQVHPESDVLLAIIGKLHHEGRRKSGRDRRAHGTTKAKPLPGDSRQVEPLPPSTHLYTYTSRAPPTVHDFYEQLQKRGVPLRGHCLAFVVANAASLKQGFKYLHESFAIYPEARALLLPSSADDALDRRMSLFTSFIELCARFSKVPLSTALPPPLLAAHRPGCTREVLDDRMLNADHPLVHVVSLLSQRRPLHRPAWNAILAALGHESSYAYLWRALYAAPTGTVVGRNEYVCRGALVAYRLTRRVLSLMRQIHLDLDVVGFMALCNSVENMAFGAWMIMRRHHLTNESLGTATDPQTHLREAAALMRTSQHAVRLKSEFQTLIGVQDPDTSAADLNLPRLLETPSPALLHAYIRALGWLADYDALLDTVRWMVEYQGELAEKRALDRNGEVMMRRAIIAVRVFLERAWLRPEEMQVLNQADITQESGAEGSRAVKNLARLSTPASVEVVDEAVELVESVEDWGGWPSEEEVDGYCDSPRFRRFE